MRWGDHGHRQFLCLLAEGMHAQRYVELGTYTGGTFQAVAAVVTSQHGEAVGVDDTHPLPCTARTYHYRMRTETFFTEGHAARHGPYDLVFIDADHRYAAVKQDFWSIFPLVQDQGLVVLHDTYPPDAAHLDVGYCADSWRFAYELAWEATNDARYEVLTLPIVPGYTLVRKCQTHLAWQSPTD